MQICSAMAQVCRDPETLDSADPSSKPSVACPGLSPTVPRNLPSGCFLLLSPFKAPTHHTAYSPKPLPLPFLLSHPHTCLFLRLLCWAMRTSLSQCLNSPHVAAGMLDSTSGHVGSGASPTSSELHSQMESEDHTNSASFIVRTK